MYTFKLVGGPDAVLWIVGAVRVTAEALPREPTHGRSAGQPVLQALAGGQHAHHQQEARVHKHSLFFYLYTGW